MATETQYAGTVANNTDSPFSSDSGWTDPTNASGDTTSTSAYISGPGFSDTGKGLHCTNFGFSAVSGTVNGILVEIEMDSFSGTTTEHLRIVKGGTIGSDSTHDGTSVPTSKGWVSVGSGSDTWGESWLDSDITASTFGAAFNATFGGGPPGTWVFAYRVKITVDYTAGGGGGAGGGVNMLTLGVG